MNRSNHIIYVLFFLMSWLSPFVMNSQVMSRYVFASAYIEYEDTVQVMGVGDTVFEATNLFHETGFPRKVIFTYRDKGVYLTLNGKESLFFGEGDIGHWPIGGPSEDVTVAWDTIVCESEKDTIFQFEFVPYYGKENPFPNGDGTVTYYNYDDATTYYWTCSAGVVAIGGEWPLVRKDQEYLMPCLFHAPRCFTR
ncbi:MAG: hypothetical protein J5741_03755 [Bacteroidales bacterium]|nr:hypothetical protein [Bacteroidales bacterium]